MKLWKKDLIRLAIIIAMITYVCTNCVFSSKMHVVSFYELPFELQDSLTTIKYYMDKYYHYYYNSEADSLFHDFYHEGLLNDPDNLRKIENSLNPDQLKERENYEYLINSYLKNGFNIYIDTDYEIETIFFASFIISFKLLNKSNGKWRTYSYSDLIIGSPLIIYKNEIYIPLGHKADFPFEFRKIDFNDLKFGKYTLSTW